jgi:hypothetical protein
VFRRTSVLTALLALVAGTLLLVGPGPVAASAPAAAGQAAQSGPVPGERCRIAGKKVFKLRDIRHSIRVAYARSFVLSPDERLRIVRHVRKDQTVSSHQEVTGGGQLEFKGLVKKLLATVEARVDVQVVDFETTYTSKTTTVRKSAHNITKKNRQFIAYKGTHQYKGKFKLFHCTKHPVMTHPEWTLRSSGKWRSHRPLEVGTIRCGAGYPTAVSKFVASRHCG